MDYKELIDELRMVASWNISDCYDCNQCVKAATAIETLLAERDAAVKIISRGEKRCRACIYNDHGIHDFPCCHCRETGGMTDYWEWRGPLSPCVKGKSGRGRDE